MKSGNLVGVGAGGRLKTGKLVLLMKPFLAGLAFAQNWCWSDVIQDVAHGSGSNTISTRW
tara:strand:+ start:76 stop:255 length:180 start_codon:yes stop_codon:yes gene_type:complete